MASLWPWLALTAVAVHTVAMLAVGGVLSIGVCRGVDLCRGAAGRAPEASASSRALAWRRAQIAL